MFYAFLYFSGLSWLEQERTARGIPAEVLCATLQDLELWMHHCRKRTGHWGLPNKNWLANHFFGKFLRLGRLQFNLEQFLQPFLALRHKYTRNVILVAEAEACFRGDGQFAAADERVATDAWTAVFRNENGKITAHPVSPRLGRVEVMPVQLLAAEYEIVLRRGDEILGIHIPVGGSMDCDACGDSLKQALELFPKYFPETNIRALNCVSWFLDPQFAGLLPASANIRRFQEEFYLYPVSKANDSQMFLRVFGSLDFREHPELAPRQTSLQRLILDHIQTGGRWRSGGCLMLPEDFNWGDRIYHLNHGHAKS
jgi:hypothetical protein